jgi:phosphomannomutase
MRPIRFGTEGWRAVIAEDYTFDNVRAVARAAAAWFRQQPKRAPVAVGHDTRFLAARFAAAVADELAAAGVKPLLCAGPLPTPAICFEVVRKELAGAVVLTASHNPGEYNGVKVKRPEGASVMEQDAKWIEAEANRIIANPSGEWAPPQDHERFDVREAYIERVVSMVDTGAIRDAKLTVVADLMHGAGIGYFDEALRRAGCADVAVLRANPDPTFEGKHPEPIGPNLEHSVAMTGDPKVDIGVATDGDADRFGMMAHGEYIDIQRTIVYILYHLLKNRGWRGKVMRAVNVTSMVDHLCDHFGVRVVETAVGFKNMAQALIESPQDYLLAVEESGGFGIRGHVPDRDGTLTALIACEARAQEGKPVGKILEDIFSLVGGRRYFDRVDLRVTPQQREALAARMHELHADKLAGRKVENVNRTDGAKLIRDDGTWLLLRLSGTEPLVRIYAEGLSADDVDSLLKAGEQLVHEATGG